MPTRTRLAAFAAALAAVFALALLAGRAIDLGHGDAAAGHGHDGNHDDAHAEAAGSAAAAAGTVDGELRIVPAAVEHPRGRPARFSFRVVDADGRAVRDYDVEHEAQMHLIVARRDLTGYQHVHPTLDPEGVWSVELQLPEPGVYRAFADFSSGGRSFTLGMDLTAPGDVDPEPFAASSATEVAGHAVTLQAEARAGVEQTLRFRIDRDGEPVAQLEPYLGALGHLVVLREGDLAFLHVHPEDAAEPGEIAFAATFPSAGRYALFLQFQTGGRVHTAPLYVEVQP